MLSARQDVLLRSKTNKFPLKVKTVFFYRRLIFSHLQTVLRLTQSSSLSPSCSRLLLQITSSLLLGENITLPRALIQETVQKVCAFVFKRGKKMMRSHLDVCKDICLCDCTCSL